MIIIFETAHRAADIAHEPQECTKRPVHTPQQLSPQEEKWLIEQLEEELKNTRRHLQITIEDLDASNEELRSSNEELRSTNEELQSTAEKLDTSKEELQLVNEELNFTNEQLHRHIDELATKNNDMKNMLENTHIPILFLDRQLRAGRSAQDERAVSPAAFGYRPLDLRHPCQARL
ncbi:MAG TPA: hypothetical protein VHJ19_05555 [Gammaproteobacteria bacterium]|nr:hypothetical protein [Gammaproteobacteria bacterium]